MTATEAIGSGRRQLARHRKLVGFFYICNLIFALIAILPIAIMISGVLGHSLESDRQFVTFGPDWVVAFLKNYDYAPASMTSVLLVALAILYMLWSTFLDGGAIAIFVKEQDAFFSACARFFPRLFRLFLISLVFYAIVLAIDGALAGAQRSAFKNSMVEYPSDIVSWVRTAVIFFLLALVNMIFDYGKIIAIADDRRSAFGSTRRAIGFVRAHFGRTLAIYWLCMLIGFVLLVICHFAAESMAQQSVVTVLLVFLVRQVYMILRMWVRLLTWSSEAQFYKDNLSVRAVLPDPTPGLRVEAVAPFSEGLPAI